MNKRFRVADRLRSFNHAGQGLYILVKSQHNAWIHALATLMVCAAGAMLKLGSFEWCWIVLSIALVWLAEACNTAIELLADAAVPHRHPLVRKAKDVAAAGVLLAAVAAFLIAMLVFWPRFEI